MGLVTKWHQFYFSIWNPSSLNNVFGLLVTLTFDLETPKLIICSHCWMTPVGPSVNSYNAHVARTICHEMTPVGPHDVNAFSSYGWKICFLIFEWHWPLTLAPKTLGNWPKTQPQWKFHRTQSLRYFCSTIELNLLKLMLLVKEEWKKFCRMWPVVLETNDWRVIGRITLSIAQQWGITIPRQLKYSNFCFLVSLYSWKQSNNKKVFNLHQ